MSLLINLKLKYKKYKKIQFALNYYKKIMVFVPEIENNATGMNFGYDCRNMKFSLW